MTALAALLILAADAPPPGHLRMALVSFRAAYTDLPDPKANAANLASNVERHVAFIAHAAGKGAGFVGFPELSLNGYRFGKALSWLKTDGPEVGALARAAKDKGVFVAAGLAEVDGDGKKWNTHVLIGPDGELVGKHRKIYLTAEKGHVEAGTRHDVFDVKGLKVGIAICADGSDFANLKALADNGAKVIYAPHCNSTGGTTAKWYAFRAKWAGPDGWVAKLKVHAALHNNAGQFAAIVPAPPGKHGAERWAGGAWFIGPDGKTLAQLPPSTTRAGSAEAVLMHDVPLPR